MGLSHGFWKPLVFVRAGISALLALTTVGAALPGNVVAEDAYPVESGLHADARVQITFTRMIVYDDADWIGPGEIELYIGVELCKSEECNFQEASSVGMVVSTVRVEAGTGDQVELNHVIPRDAIRLINGATKAGGIPLSRGNAYKLGLHIVEWDVAQVFDIEDEGTRRELRLTEANHWSLGRHTTRLFDRPDDDGPLVDIEYEIALAPLPDLVATGLAVSDTADPAAKRVCMGVENRGPVGAGPFSVDLLLDGTQVRRNELDGLAAGDARGPCFALLNPPTSGRHSLLAIVDEPHTVFELSDENNSAAIFYVPQAKDLLDDAPTLTTAPSPPVSSDVSRSAPGNTQATTAGGVQASGKTSVSVDEVRVKGKNPGGQNDCDPGKNDVTVTVKNGGAGASAGHSVRLDVDGDDEATKTLGAIDAGKTASTTFDDIELKRGDHKLTVSVRETSAGSGDAVSRELLVTCRDE